MTAEPPEPAKRRWPAGLIAFWVVVLAGIGAGAAYLQYLGPPDVVATSGPPALPAPKPVVKAAAKPPAPKPPAPQIGELTVKGSLGATSTLPEGAAIPPPNPKLLAASDSNPKWLEPQISADGATPMHEYAAGAPSGVTGPELAIMVAGLGDDISQSLTATSLLPPAVSLAISPYGHQLPATQNAARATGHEMILILPTPALLVSLPLTENQGTLDWAMAQIAGYAGVTDAFGPDMSGGFMNDAFSKSWLLTNVATRGLFYIEGNTNIETNPLVWGRTADEVMDSANGTAEENAELTALAATAQSQHTALGILLNPTPDAVKILADWCKTLAAQGISLVPVSALVVPPVPDSSTTASAKP